MIRTWCVKWSNPTLVVPLLGPTWMSWKIWPTFIRKMFKTNSSFYVNYRFTRQVRFLLFRRLLLVLTKSFILGYFLIFSYFLVSLFYSLLVMIALYFTCDERKICSTMKKSQNIMNMIVGGTCYLSDIFFIVYLHRKKVPPESDVFNLG